MARILCYGMKFSVRITSSWENVGTFVSFGDSRRGVAFMMICFPMLYLIQLLISTS